MILSPLLAPLLLPLPPVQAALAVQQVHVAAGSPLLLAANHSAVQPLAPPLDVPQEMLDRHILARARAHGRGGDLGGACHRKSPPTDLREEEEKERVGGGGGEEEEEEKELEGRGEEEERERGRRRAGGRG